MVIWLFPLMVVTLVALMIMTQEKMADNSMKFFLKRATPIRDLRYLKRIMKFVFSPRTKWKYFLDKIKKRLLFTYLFI